MRLLSSIVSLAIALGSTLSLAQNATIVDIHNTTLADGTTYVCPYTSHEYIRNRWDYLINTDYGPFVATFTEELDWTVMGTSPLAGHYSSKRVFLIDALARIFNTVDPSVGLSFELTRITGGCDDSYSVQEFILQGLTTNGLKIDNPVIWVTEWDKNGIITLVRAYVDTYFVWKSTMETEYWTNATWRVNRTDLTPGPGGQPNWTAYGITL